MLTTIDHEQIIFSSGFIRASFNMQDWTRISRDIPLCRKLKVRNCILQLPRYNGGMGWEVNIRIGNSTRLKIYRVCLGFSSFRYIRRYIHRASRAAFVINFLSSRHYICVPFLTHTFSISMPRPHTSTLR